MGILTNDNFSVNAPKIIDDRYSVSGVTPYVSVAAANAAIAISRRAIGLTVNVANVEYWYQNGITDGDLVIKSGGSSSSVVSTTKANLLNLISTNAVVVDTIYSVTDAQDALGGNITVLGTSVNSVNGNGTWKFTAKLPAQGFFKIQSGTSGSINQISVLMPSGSQNLLTASIPYTTSRNNTAALTVANINANSAVSGCRAFVITSTTSGGNFDTPIICVDAVETTTSFVHTMTITSTTLVISGKVNPTLGFTPRTLILKSFYDVTNDRILYAEDDNFGTSISLDISSITTLTYNPITTFRWNDLRFLGLTFINSGYRNTVFRNSITVTWKNIQFSKTNIERVIFSNTDTNLVRLESSTIQNINSFALNITNSNGRINASNIDCSSISINPQQGSEITFSNSTFGVASSLATVALEKSSTSIGISNVNYTSANNFTIFDNQGLSVTLSIQGTITGPCSIIGNIFLGNTFFTFNNTTVATVSITNSIFKDTLTVTSNTLLNFIVKNCTFNDTFSLTGNIFSGNINLENVNFNSNGTDSFIINASVSAALNILNSDFTFTNNSIHTFTVFNIVNAYVDESIVFGIINGQLNIVNSVLEGDISLGSGETLSLIDIQNSTLKNVALGLTQYIKILNNSNLSGFTLTAGFPIAKVDIDNCSFTNLVVSPDLEVGISTTADFVIVDSVIFNTEFYIGDKDLFTFSNLIVNNSILDLAAFTGAINLSVFQNSKINFSTIKLRTLTDSISITKLFADNSVLQDDISLATVVENINIEEFTIQNSSITYFLPGVTTGNSIIKSSVINTKPIIFDNGTSNVLNYTVMNEGTYRVSYTHDFSVNPLPINITFTISDILKDYSYGVIAYTSGNSLIAGAGTTLGLGLASAGYNQYINNSLITAINAANTVRTSGTNNRLATTDQLAFRALIGGIASGKLTFILEGQLLQD